MSDEGIISILSQLSENDSIQIGKLGHAIKRLIIVKYYCSNDTIKYDNDVINMLLTFLNVPIYVDVYNTKCEWVGIPLISVSYDKYSDFSNEKLSNVKDFNCLYYYDTFRLFNDDEMIVRLSEETYIELELFEEVILRIEAGLNKPILEDPDFKGRSVNLKYTYTELYDMLSDKSHHLITFNDILDI